MSPSIPSCPHPSHHVPIHPIMSPSTPSCPHPPHNVPIHPIMSPSIPSCPHPSHHVPIHPIVSPSTSSCLNPIMSQSTSSCPRPPHHVPAHPIMSPSTPSCPRPPHHVSIHPIMSPSTPSCPRPPHHVSIHPIMSPPTPSCLHPPHHVPAHPIMSPSTPSCPRPPHHVSIHPIMSAPTPSCPHPPHHVPIHPIMSPPTPSCPHPPHHVPSTPSCPHPPHRVTIHPIMSPPTPSCPRPPHHVCPESVTTMVCPESVTTLVCPESVTTMVCPESVTTMVCPESVTTMVCPESVTTLVCPESVTTLDQFVTQIESQGAPLSWSGCPIVMVWQGLLVNDWIGTIKKMDMLSYTFGLPYGRLHGQETSVPTVSINGANVPEGQTYKSSLTRATDADHVICQVRDVDNITLTCGKFSETNKEGVFLLFPMKESLCYCSGQHSSGCYTESTSFNIQTSKILTFTANKIGFSANVSVGEDVHLECSTDGQVYDTMIIANETTNLTSGNNVNRISYHFKSTQQSVGPYKCLAYTRDNTSVYQTLRVLIKLSPAKIISFTANGRHGNQEFKSGNIVDFRCDTQGFPVPDITVKDTTSGQKLPHSTNSTGSSVIVRKKLECHQHQEVQIFECIADNFSGGTPPAKSSVELTVQCTSGADQREVLSVFMICFIAISAMAALIQDFTVNGAPSVRVHVGDPLTFRCSRIENVANPSWTIRILPSGRYVIGWPGLRIIAKSITTTMPAQCSLNGVIECQATLDSVTDRKTVTVEVASLIQDFTVNGATSVRVNVGDPVTFICSRQENVSNPNWSIKAVTSGKYILGGPSMTFSSKLVNYSTNARCDYNGVIECQAKLGSTADSKTVNVVIPCDSSQTPGDRSQTTTPKNGAESAKSTTTTLLLYSALSIIFAFYGLD
ncbi:hypothetical protein Btru_000890 [Bulinus truncatus]|nr:hypothetical protein Btru_000890 [Bulinus truncatus]